MPGKARLSSRFPLFRPILPEKPPKRRKEAENRAGQRLSTPLSLGRLLKNALTGHWPVLQLRERLRCRSGHGPGPQALRCFSASLLASDERQISGSKVPNLDDARQNAGLRTSVASL
jgi:hypothetical protein